MLARSVSSEHAFKTCAYNPASYSKPKRMLDRTVPVNNVTVCEAYATPCASSRTPPPAAPEASSSLVSLVVSGSAVAARSARRRAVEGERSEPAVTGTSPKSPSNNEVLPWPDCPQTMRCSPALMSKSMSFKLNCRSAISRLVSDLSAASPSPSLSSASAVGPQVSVQVRRDTMGVAAVAAWPPGRISKPGCGLGRPPLECKPM
mmetsp:Transcript_9866/g.24540  ORF Transcript_9866/g.24540 Transcript_9866/m.24540 type:complete len:204 (-) Transcript_9866:1386-1997(-)